MEPPCERSLECSECKKPITTIYTEIVGKTVYRICMCADCPVLQHRLRGTPSHPCHPSDALETGLCCGNCGTTADEIRMGAPLGCSLCYEVFEDLLTHELVSAEKFLHKQPPHNKISPLHLGRIPGQAAEVNLAQRLLSLHQALNETLSKEDYEQAAWLRDQIKALTEDTQNHGQGTSPQ